MGFDSLDKTSLLLNLIAKKQQVLSSNLANVNTPGYQRQDIDFSQILGSLGSPLETKLSQKFGPPPVIRQNGGEVSTAAEMIEMQKNMLFYTLATRRISSVITELRTIAQLGK